MGKQERSTMDIKGTRSDCGGTGYLLVHSVTGLQPDDVYQEPHIERCDGCMHFPTDLLALKYACQQAVAQTD